MEEFTKEYLANIWQHEITVKKAREIQRFIASRLMKEDPKDYRIIAGLDSAYHKNMMFTAITFFDLEENRIIGEEYSIEEVKFPYIPTLLFLREGPPMFRIAERAKIKADVYLVDGHGEAHPYRAGLACFVGYLLDKPTIGVAKSRLFGRLEMHDDEGVLKDGDEEIALVIRICKKNFYISVGNRITLRGAFEIFKKTIYGCNSLPLERAHILANEIKAKYESGKVDSPSSGK